MRAVCGRYSTYNSAMYTFSYYLSSFYLDKFYRKRKALWPTCRHGRHSSTLTIRDRQAQNSVHYEYTLLPISNKMTTSKAQGLLSITTMSNIDE